MQQSSKLLESAEKVCKLFGEVIEQVSDNQVEAMKALLKMAVAVNELTIEVNKGKETLAQFAKMKQEIFDQAQATIEQTAEEITDQPQPQTKSPVDPEQLVKGILSSFNLPEHLIPKKDNPGQ